MYQGGMLAKQEAEKRTEEAMMTGKPVQQEENSELNRVSSLAMSCVRSLYQPAQTLTGIYGPVIY